MTVFIKICGLTTVDDALLSVALGADAVGFVLAPSSRQIAPPRVTEIVRNLPPGVLTVGVFRNASPKQVIEVVNRCGLRAVQLHGHESPEEIRQVREAAQVVIKGFAANSAALTRADRYAADMVLVDSATPGSGQVYDWSLAGNAPDGLRLILAGGLNPQNVCDAMAQVRPFGVDVSSGVELSPGHKDPALLRAFIETVRGAEPDQPSRPDLEDMPYNWDLEQYR